MLEKENHLLVKYKFTIFSVVLFLIVFFGGSAAFIHSMRRVQFANAGRALSQTVKVEKLRLEAAVNGEIALVLKMANSPLIQRYFLNPGDSELEGHAFEELAEYGHVFVPKSIFWVNDKDKKFYFNGSYTYTVNPDAPDSYWYNMTLNGTEAFNFNINYNPDLDQTNFWINAPVFDSGHKPIGVLGTGIDVSAFVYSVFHDYFGDTPLFYFNEAGEITGADDKDLVADKVSLENKLGKTGSEIFSMRENLEDNEAHYFFVSEGIAALIAIPDFDWYVCSILPFGLKYILNTSMTLFFIVLMIVVAGIFIIFNLIHTNLILKKERNVYRNMSIIDVLTGIYNRRFLEEDMKRLIKSLSRSGGKLSLLMLDIDFFKKYNDTYGHGMGDDCLKTVANTLSHNLLRADDYIARYGGEEFVVVLPNVDEDGAHLIALRLIYSLRERGIPHEKNEAANFVTISVGGVTGKVLHNQTAADYFVKADEALYLSKQNGRNRYTPGDSI